MTYYFDKPPQLKKRKYPDIGGSYGMEICNAIHSKKMDNISNIILSPKQKKYQAFFENVLKQNDCKQGYFTKTGKEAYENNLNHFERESMKRMTSLSPKKPGAQNNSTTSRKLSDQDQDSKSSIWSQESSGKKISNQFQAHSAEKDDTKRKAQKKSRLKRFSSIPKSNSFFAKTSMKPVLRKMTTQPSFYTDVDVGKKMTIIAGSLDSSMSDLSFTPHIPTTPVVFSNDDSEENNEEYYDSEMPKVSMFMPGKTLNTKSVYSMLDNLEEGEDEPEENVFYEMHPNPSFYKDINLRHQSNLDRERMPTYVPCYPKEPVLFRNKPSVTNTPKISRFQPGKTLNTKSVYSMLDNLEEGEDEPEENMFYEMHPNPSFYKDINLKHRCISPQVRNMDRKRMPTYVPYYTKEPVLLQNQTFLRNDSNFELPLHQSGAKLNSKDNQLNLEEECKSDNNQETQPNVQIKGTHSTPSNEPSNSHQDTQNTLKEVPNRYEYSGTSSKITFQNPPSYSHQISNNGGKSNPDISQMKKGFQKSVLIPNFYYDVNNKRKMTIIQGKPFVEVEDDIWMPYAPHQSGTVDRYSFPSMVFNRLSKFQGGEDLNVDGLFSIEDDEDEEEDEYQDPLEVKAKLQPKKESVDSSFYYDMDRNKRMTIIGGNPYLEIEDDIWVPYTPAQDYQFPGKTEPSLTFGRIYKFQGGEKLDTCGIFDNEDFEKAQDDKDQSKNKLAKVNKDLLKSDSSKTKKNKKPIESKSTPANLDNIVGRVTSIQGKPFVEVENGVFVPFMPTQALNKSIKNFPKQHKPKNEHQIENVQSSHQSTRQPQSNTAFGKKSKNQDVTIGVSGKDNMSEEIKFLLNSDSSKTKKNKKHVESKSTPANLDNIVGRVTSIQGKPFVEVEDGVFVPFMPTQALNKSIKNFPTQPIKQSIKDKRKQYKSTEEEHSFDIYYDVNTKRRFTHVNGEPYVEIDDDVWVPYIPRQLNKKNVDPDLNFEKISHYKVGKELDMTGLDMTNVQDDNENVKAPLDREKSSRILNNPQAKYSKLVENDGGFYMQEEYDTKTPYIPSKPNISNIPEDLGEKSSQFKKGHPLDDNNIFSVDRSTSDFNMENTVARESRFLPSFYYEGIRNPRLTVIDGELYAETEDKIWVPFCPKSNFIRPQSTSSLRFDRISGYKEGKPLNWDLLFTEDDEAAINENRKQNKKQPIVTQNKSDIPKKITKPLNHQNKEKASDSQKTITRQDNQKNKPETKSDKSINEESEYPNVINLDGVLYREVEKDLWVPIDVNSFDKLPENNTKVKNPAVNAKTPIQKDIRQDLNSDHHEFRKSERLPDSLYQLMPNSIHTKVSPNSVPNNEHKSLMKEKNILKNDIGSKDNTTITSPMVSANVRNTEDELVNQQNLPETASKPNNKNDKRPQKLTNEQVCLVVDTDTNEDSYIMGYDQPNYKNKAFSDPAYNKKREEVKDYPQNRMRKSPDIQSFPEDIAVGIEKDDRNRYDPREQDRRRVPKDHHVGQREDYLRNYEGNDYMEKPINNSLPKNWMQTFPGEICVDVEKNDRNRYHSKEQEKKEDTIGQRKEHKVRSPKKTNDFVKEQSSLSSSKNTEDYHRYYAKPNSSDLNSSSDPNRHQKIKAVERKAKSRPDNYQKNEATTFLNRNVPEISNKKKSPFSGMERGGNTFKRNNEQIDKSRPNGNFKDFQGLSSYENSDSDYIGKARTKNQPIESDTFERNYATKDKKVFNPHVQNEKFSPNRKDLSSSYDRNNKKLPEKSQPFHRESKNVEHRHQKKMGPSRFQEAEDFDVNKTSKKTASSFYYKEDKNDEIIRIDEICKNEILDFSRINDDDSDNTIADDVHDDGFCLNIYPQFGSKLPENRLIKMEHNLWVEEEFDIENEIERNHFKLFGGDDSYLNKNIDKEKQFFNHSKSSKPRFESQDKDSYRDLRLPKNLEKGKQSNLKENKTNERSPIYNANKIQNLPQRTNRDDKVSRPCGRYQEDIWERELPCAVYRDNFSVDNNELNESKEHNRKNKCPNSKCDRYSMPKGKAKDFQRSSLGSGVNGGSKPISKKEFSTDIVKPIPSSRDRLYDSHEFGFSYFDQRSGLPNNFASSVNKPNSRSVKREIVAANFDDDYADSGDNLMMNNTCILSGEEIAYHCKLIEQSSACNNRIFSEDTECPMHEIAAAKPCRMKNNCPIINEVIIHTVTDFEEDLTR